MYSSKNLCSVFCLLLAAFFLFVSFNEAYAQATYKVIAVSGKIDFEGKEVVRNNQLDIDDLATFQNKAKFSSKQDWIKLLNIKNNEITRVHALETSAYALGYQKQHVPLASRSANPYKYYENDTSLIKSLSLFYVNPKTIKNKTFLNAYLTGSEYYWIWGNDTLIFNDKNYPLTDKEFLFLKTLDEKRSERISNNEGQIIFKRTTLEQLQSGQLNLFYSKNGKEEILVSNIQVINIAAEISALKNSGLTVEEITEDIIRVFFRNDASKPNYNISVIIDQIRNIVAGN
jgi:hypothetical protein